MIEFFTSQKGADVLLVIAIIVIAFLVLREIICWYFKINERNRLLQKLCNQNIHIINALNGKTDGIPEEALKPEAKKGFLDAGLPAEERQ